MNHLEANFRQKTGVNFNTFYRENKQKLVWYITRWTRDVEIAEDYAEDAFIRALNKVDTYCSDRARPNTWLYTIALNIVKKDYIDKKKVQVTSMDKKLNEDNTRLEDFMAYQDTKEDNDKLRENMVKANIIRDTITNLPDKYEKYRIVLIMRELDNLSYDEIASSLCMNKNTVKSQIKKGRELVRSKVETRIRAIEEQGLDIIVPKKVK